MSAIDKLRQASDILQQIIGAEKLGAKVTDYGPAADALSIPSLTCAILELAERVHKLEEELDYANEACRKVLAGEAKPEDYIQSTQLKRVRLKVWITLFENGDAKAYNYDPTEIVSRSSEHLVAIVEREIEFTIGDGLFKSFSP